MSSPSQSCKTTVPTVPPLTAILADVPDFRQARGKRHPLGAILTLACVAMLCGYRSPSAIAEWGGHYGSGWLSLFGFRGGKAPSPATFQRVFRGVDVRQLEQRLAAWAEGVLQVLEPAYPAYPGASSSELERLEPVAMDGKSLRGSRKQGAQDAHLLSAVSHRLAVVLGQVAVCDKSNEIGAVHELLAHLVLQGRLITGDALLTQQEVARTITSHGGDYLMVVKANQPTLLRDIQDLFFTADTSPNLLADMITTAREVRIRSGKVEERVVEVSSALTGYSEWPGLQQVLRIKRTVTKKRTGRTTHEVGYAVTSLSAQRATPEQLLVAWRKHWTIENRVHWVRDMTFDEDRQQLRKGHAPQVMAALRNTAIGLLRVLGEGNIARACRHYAAQPVLAIAAVGLLPRE